ncbi:MAG: STAS domain-containing protein, partial [Chloroflexota bacterium]
AQTTRELPALYSIEMKALSEKIWMITPSGRLDAAQSKHLASVLSGQLEMQHRWLIVNMAAVETISSTGLKMLVNIWQRARDLKGDLVLTGVLPDVREVLQMIGLDLVFKITNTTEQARAYFTSKSK